MTYTTLTIGPIHKTLQSVKSAKAIWAASYMFSYLMKEIIKKIKEQNNGIKFIVPYSDEININKNKVNPLDPEFKNGTGLFPDRFIIEGDYKLQPIIDAVRDKFIQKVAENFKKDKDAVTKYFNDYLNFYHLNVEFTEKDFKKINVIFKIYKLLDTLELQQRIIPEAEPDYLNKFLEDIYYNFLIKNEFEKDEERFPSTIEISKAEYKAVDEKKYRHLVNILFSKKKNKDKDSIATQQQFIDAVKNEELFKPTIRNYQKYIAVVQADGDNMGAFIKYLYSLENSDNLLKHFSKNLLSFAIEAVKLIKEYKGTPIYAGGDDLLFFAPVAHTTVTKENDKEKVKIDKTILTLIDEIDDVFKKYFQEDDEFKSIIADDKLEKKPSMSFGASISYYKFPLNEALEKGANQLFSVAKQTNNKNAVSYAVLKHSGQTYGTTFNKNEESKSFKTFKKLISENVTGENFIHSLVYKLEPQKAVLYSIGSVSDKSERNKMFDNFFENNFNESIHTYKDTDGKKKLTPFLEQTKQLFKDVYSENSLTNSKNEMEKQNKKNLQKIYAALRFIGFIINEEERDE